MWVSTEHCTIESQPVAFERSNIKREDQTMSHFLRLRYPRGHPLLQHVLILHALEKAPDGCNQNSSPRGK